MALFTLDKYTNSDILSCNIMIKQILQRLIFINNSQRLMFFQEELES